MARAGGEWAFFDFTAEVPELPGPTPGAEDDGTARSPANSPSYMREDRAVSRSRSPSRLGVETPGRQVRRLTSTCSISSAESGVRAAGGCDHWARVWAKPTEPQHDDPFVPDIPDTIQDPMDWPHRLIADSKMFVGEAGNVRLGRVLHMLSKGQAWHEDFAGRGSWSLVWKMMVTKLRARGHIVPASRYIHWRTCDRSKQTLLNTSCSFWP